MMYLNEDYGRAIGALVAASGFDAEVEITIDSVIIRFRKEAPRKEESSKNLQDVSKKPKSKKKAKAHLTKTAKKKRGNWRSGEKVTFNGESLTRREWAEKLGITESGVSYRIQQYGNPFGSKSPRPSDSDKVVAAS